MNTEQLTRESLQAFADRRREGFEWELRNLVEMPTVSSDPRRRDDIWRCAEYSRDMFFRYGFEAEILETGGHPVVFGRMGRDRGLPTATVYNHLDVHPVGEPEWTTDPFRMIVDGDLFKGRGTTDNKGPAITAFYGAIAAQEAGCPLNIRFIWEMEEEIGSPSLRGCLERHREKLRTDIIVVSDTAWITRGKPSNPAGFRGLKNFSLFLETAGHDLHSGTVGGAARNPLTELMMVVSSMMDGETGRVKIPGFYKDVVKPSRNELEEWANSGFCADTFRKDHALKLLRTQDSMKIMKRIWGRPTLEVHGISGGSTGPGIRTSIPARAEVKMSCRLVPGMDEQTTFEQIRTFVVKHFPDVQVREESGLDPFRGHATGPRAEALREAYRFAFGSPCVFTREGSSLDSVKILEEVLEAEVYFLGLSLPGHGRHAPNEHYDWEQASSGMATFAKYFEFLSRQAPATAQ